MEIVAAAEIVPDKLEKYREQTGIPNGYTDYREMLERERLDFVSIVTWPPLHAEIAVAAAQAGVRGILCEKPMTLSLEDADRMLYACRDAGTMLVVNHQRRFAAPYVTARNVVAQGALGDVIQMETFLYGSDLLTDATHAVDLFRFYAGDRPVEWVYAQVTAGKRTRYGHPVEDLSLVYMKFEGETRALLTTGRIPVPSFEEGPRLGPAAAYCSARIIGTEGMLEVAGDLSKAPPLRRLSSERAGWEEIRPQSLSSLSAMGQSVQRMIECVETGSRDHLNGGTHARKSLEVLLAAFVSARKREVVHLPLLETGFTYDALRQAGSA
jgi:predicted dehydrogenase